MNLGTYKRPRLQIVFARCIHTVIACVTACLPFTSFAQAPEFRWVRQSAPGNQRIMDVAYDHHGNACAVGTLNFSPIFAGPPSLKYETVGIPIFFVRKYDGSGNLIWSRQAGENEASLGARCAIDAQGNIFVAGSFASATLDFGGIVLTNSGTINVFLAKFSPEGNLLWARQGGGTDGTDEPTDIAVGVSGSVYLSGSLGSTNAVFGNQLLSGPSATTNNVRSFLVKYDTSGSVVWAYQNMGFRSTGLGADALENLYVLGSFNAVVDFGAGIELTNADSGETFHTCMAKYDSTGNALWARQIASGDPNLGTTASEPSTADCGIDLAVDKNGNSYVTGIFESTNAVFGGIALTNRGYLDVFVAKLDSGGELSWVRGIGGRGMDIGSCITVDAAGNCYIAGFYFAGLLDFSGITLQGSIAVDSAFTAKYDANGNLQWARNACKAGSGSIGWAHPNAIASDSLGNLLLGGAFSSDTVIFDGITLTNSGFFIAKIEGPRLTGITIGNQLLLSWPTNATGLHLESAAHLSGPWSMVTNSVVVNGNQKTVTIEASSASQFFRLNGP